MRQDGNMTDIRVYNKNQNGMSSLIGVAAVIFGAIGLVKLCMMSLLAGVVGLILYPVLPIVGLVLTVF